MLGSGQPAADDPQHDILLPIAPVAKVEVIHDGETLRVGGLAVTAHFTPGHTLGGTSWTWQSCEAQRCLNLVYADSLTAVSAPGYRYSDHPDLLAGFQRSFAWLRQVPCDILLTPHSAPIRSATPPPAASSPIRASNNCGSAWRGRGSGNRFDQRVL